mgnify:CR=1 FL=1
MRFLFCYILNRLRKKANRKLVDVSLAGKAKAIKSEIEEAEYTGVVRINRERIHNVLKHGFRENIKIINRFTNFIEDILDKYF